MAETLRIEIPIETVDNTDPGVSNATKKFEKMERAANSANSSAKKASDTVSKFDKQAQKTEKSLASWAKEKYEVLLEAKERISPVLSTLGNGLRSFAGKTWSVTMRAIDLITSPVRGIKAILKEATNTRKVFIEGILSGRINKITDEKKVEADLFEQMMSYETFTGHNTLKKFFVGCEIYNAPKEELEAAEKKMEGLSVLHKLLCMVSAMAGEEDLVDNWHYTYDTIGGGRVKALYKVLEQYGFQFPNDEEKSVVEGTSDLYVKKEC